MAYLTFGVCFPLFSEGSPGQFVMERQQGTRELQNIRALRNPEKAQNAGGVQNIRESRNMENPKDTVEIQNRKESQNIKELQNTTQLLNWQEPQTRDEPQDKPKIKLTGNRLTIEDLPENEVLEIYNIMGTMVFNQRVNAGTTQVTLPVPRGYYIIKIGKFTRKIAIK